MSPVIPDSADLSCLVLLLNKQNTAKGSLLDSRLCVLFFTRVVLRGKRGRDDK